jgi:chromatin remodeling complex protein RSC6
VPQANLNVCYGALNQEIENPSAIRVLPPQANSAGGSRPNVEPLEELARLAFPVTKAEKSTAEKTKTTPPKRKPNAAFMRPVQPDEKLSTIVGSKPLPRSELTKKLWDYIKKNGCQDKKKRTMINANDSLKRVFNGKSQVSMFEMTKLVSGHIKK